MERKEDESYMDNIKGLAIEKNVSIKKAFYLCSCTKEFLTDDIPNFCPTCELKLSRIIQFMARRTIRDGKITYPECGIH